MAASLTQVDKLQIEILVDNHIEWMSPLPPGFSHEPAVQMRNGPPVDTELTGLPFVDLENYCCGAHGLSFVLTTTIDGKEEKLLFDTGPDSQSIIRNLKALKINPSSITQFALSHWHADHSGGLLAFLSYRNTFDPLMPIVCDMHPHRPVARGIAPPPMYKPAYRLPSDPEFDAMEKLGAIVEKHEEGHERKGGFWVSGKIERVTEFENGLFGSIQWKEGKWEEDLMIWDERYCVVDVNPKGLVIFSSCSHAGIVNVVLDAMKNFPGRPVHAVLGGLHLAGPELAYRVPPTVDFFTSLSPQPEYILPLHCTGHAAKVELAKALGEKIVPAATGSLIMIPPPLMPVKKE